jgi:predicted SnoaL-like aldol condensation-catalyzing enzyme
MSDLEQNKRIAVEFLELAFNERRPEEASERYQSPNYTQHNPNAADGPAAFIEFAKSFLAESPDLRLDIKRVIAEGDLVVLHIHATTAPGDLGVAAIDIFRLDNGKIVEHWDVAQAVPETSANDNTMF